MEDERVVFVTGGASGAVAGSVAGGPVTAIGTGLTAAASGAFMGMADYYQNQAIRKEDKDYKIDMYNYQLGNIKAQPYSLTKVSSQSYNYKIFPFIEFYDCTDEEKLMMRNKIKYDGMTVQSIYKLSDFTTGFLKGKPIRLSLNAAHESVDIYNELSKGIYLGGDD